MPGEKRIILKSNKGQTLIGYYKKESRGILMIVCHGIRSYNDPELLPIIKPYLNMYNAMGISTLRFDATGFGESEGKNISVEQYLFDIGSVLDAYAGNNKEIILNVASFSGQIGAIAAVRYKKITKLMVTNGLFNFWQINPKLRIKLFLYLLKNPQYFKEIFMLQKHYHPEKITIPTLVCFSEKDTHISPNQSKDFYKHLTSDKTLIIIPGVDHEGTAMLDIMDSFQKVLNWLSKQLAIPLLKQR